MTQQVAEPVPATQAPTEIAQPPAVAAPSEAPSPAPEPKAATVKLALGTPQEIFSLLMNKPPATDDIDFLLPVDSGEPVKVSMHLEAMDGPSYDDLVAKYPPSALQRARGANYDQDKFGPALLARVVKSPTFSIEQWTQLWTNPRWSGGELSSLFWAANNLCLKGLNVPFNASV